MPSANAGYKCFALSASSLGCTRVQILYVPFDEVWCRQMVSMLSTIFLAAAPFSGRSPNYAAIPLHKEIVGYTIERCSALQELCSVDSVKGAVNARWV